MSKVVEEAYTQGFIDKCAEHGVDANAAKALLDKPDEAPLKKTKSMSPAQVAKYRAEQHKKIDQQRPGAGLAARSVLKHINSPAGHR